MGGSPADDRYGGIGFRPLLIPDGSEKEPLDTEKVCNVVKGYVISSQKFNSIEDALAKLREYQLMGRLDKDAKIYEVTNEWEVEEKVVLKD